jgi:sugar fermentation stimulation protein A
MRYGKVISGKFISRPNRFIAYVEIDGKEEVCHVKNTGRCRELLVPGATVYLEVSDNPTRKTKYDLIAVEKGSLLINMDSQAPNKVVGEWIISSGYFGSPDLIRPEFTLGDSRFDFYLESEGKRILIEVKGVTLEDDGVVSFPDAPTIRGIKHLNHLAATKSEGYDCYVIFVVQMREAKYFTPNEARHPDFAQALRYAKDRGVIPLALTCYVTADSIKAADFLEIRL